MVCPPSVPRCVPRRQARRARGIYAAHSTTSRLYLSTEQKWSGCLRWHGLARVGFDRAFGFTGAGAWRFFVLRPATCARRLSESWWLVAQHAVQHLAEPCAASFFGEHPWAHLPRRIVADVLVVATGQLGDPVALVVLMKARDRLLHDSYALEPRAIFCPVRYRNPACVRVRKTQGDNVRTFSISGIASSSARSPKQSPSSRTNRVEPPCSRERGHFHASAHDDVEADAELTFAQDEMVRRRLLRLKQTNGFREHTVGQAVEHRHEAQPVDGNLGVMCRGVEGKTLLFRPQIPVRSRTVDQIRVGPFLAESSVLENEDAIRVDHAIQLMRHRQDRSAVPSRSRVERIPASAIGSSAEVASSRIKIAGLRTSARASAIRWRCPPDRPAAALARRRVVSLRQLQDGVMNFGGPGGRFDFLIGRGGVAQADVLPNRNVEQDALLRHVPEQRVKSFE